MTVRTRNRLIALSIIAAPFVFLLGLLLFWDAEPLPPIPTLPNPNGYEDLVKAGEMASTNSWNYEAMNDAQLRETVSANTEALSLVRTGLSNECREPSQFTVPYLDRHFSELVGFKRLAQALMAEGRLAEMQGRFGDAAKSYLDLIHLGNQTARGGILIDALVGVAIENMGVTGLQKVSGPLDAKSCRKAVVTLEILDSQRQTWDEVMQQERDWSRRTFPGVRYELVRLMSRNSLNKAYQSAKQKFENQQSKTRQLIIEFAARTYELDKGHPPANLADLVPDYLKTIPQDPFTGTNMVYSP